VAVVVAAVAGLVDGAGLGVSTIRRSRNKKTPPTIHGHRRRRLGGIGGGA
jgi:hypothetical protein